MSSGLFFRASVAEKSWTNCISQFGLSSFGITLEANGAALTSGTITLRLKSYLSFMVNAFAFTGTP